MHYLIKRDRRILFDIEQARNYYDEISPGLVRKFEIELFRVFKKLEQNPHHHFKLSTTLRRANLKIFPYRLLYTIHEHEKHIIVYGLFHQKSSPGKIRRRVN
jgi:mRNA-degrading endonuclease RelE of RelBE toxin-antitoxin system